jgi:hypothetical protein
MEKHTVISLENNRLTFLISEKTNDANTFERFDIRNLRCYNITRKPSRSLPLLTLRQRRRVKSTKVFVGFCGQVFTYPFFVYQNVKKIMEVTGY